MSNMFAEVAVNAPMRQNFSYEVPEALRPVMQVGMRVRVPFGRRTVAGFVVGLSDHCDFPKCKPIHSLIDSEAIVDEHMMELTRWIAEYYSCAWSEALFAAVPAGSKKKQVGKYLTVASLAFPKEDLDAVIRNNKKAPKQNSILKQVALFDGELTPRQIADKCGVGLGVVRGLMTKKLLKYDKKLIDLDPYRALQPQTVQPPELNAEQAEVLEVIFQDIDSGKFHVELLLGVTGSGKTEVYLRAIARVLQAGKQAIVLVPEISLTPQTTLRFRERFDRVEVVHSALTASQRNRIWKSIHKGDVDVVIGPRSALFAPLPNLGLIVIDEEHDTSFKQQNTPRYNARDTAIMRAKLCSIPIILGSATPSLEHYHLAKRGRYRLLRLQKRVSDLPLPKVYRIDMGEAFKEQKRAVVLSRQLEQAMRRSLEKDEQVMLFLNRRGFSTFVRCTMCGYEVHCERCDLTMTFHRVTEELLCHYCNARTPAPKDCPSCGFAGIRYSGIGTEKVEDIISKLFPKVPRARMDSDSMASRDSYERVLGAFRRKETRILIGTQMIAKGHDFANVTLVGIVHADTQLNLPDFRAAERTFQLVSQVAGRTGRGKKGGIVIVQSFQPKHYAIRLACEHDFVQFAEQELAIREEYGYPPFGRLARVICESKIQEAVQEHADRLHNCWKKPAEQMNITLLGPAPCPIAKVRDKHRVHMILKGKKYQELKTLLYHNEELLKGSAGVSVHVDIDPQMMM